MLERLLVQWALDSDGLYIQQSGGEDTINLARKYYTSMARATLRQTKAILAPNITTKEFLRFSERLQRIYTDARCWTMALEDRDIVLGTRMHGNMIALGAGVPCVHIAHDSRTSELIETMKVPFITMYDALRCDSILELLNNVEFDPDSFDDNRHHIAKRLFRNLEALGIPIHDCYRHFRADK